MTPRYGSNVAGTFLQRIAGLTQYWRGSLRYHLRIVASGFHSGRLLITWDPHFPAVTANLQARSNCMSMVVDIQQSTDVYFTIPYMRPSAWLPVATNAATPVTSLDNFNGRITITVLNALATPSGATTAVDMVLWAYGSHDLEFAMPRTEAFGTANVPATFMLEEQCSDAPIGDKKFGNITGSFSVPGGMVMGERLTSITDLIKKMALADRPAITGPTANTFAFSLYRAGVSIGTYPRAKSHLYFLRELFVAMKGALRYAAVLYQDETRSFPLGEYQVGIAPIANEATANGQHFGALVVRSSTPNAILQVPFYYPDVFASTRPGAAITLDRAGPAVTVSSSLNNTYPTFWYGAGDDFSYSYLVPPPFDVDLRTL